MSSQTAVNSTFHPTLHHQGVPKHGFPQVLLKPDNDNKETAVSQCNSGVQRQHGFLATRRPSLSPCPYKGASHAGDTMGNAGDPLWRGAATAASPDPKFFPATVVRPRASKLKQTHHMPSKITIFPRMLNGFIKKINLAFQVGPTIQEQEESLGSPWL